MLQRTRLPDPQINLDRSETACKFQLSMHLWPLQQPQYLRLQLSNDMDRWHNDAFITTFIAFPLRDVQPWYPIHCIT